MPALPSYYHNPRDATGPLAGDRQGGMVAALTPIWEL
jgi:hypothetical protein